MKRVMISVLIAVVLATIAVSAQENALPTRINVTLYETVYRNVTYGASAVDWGENTTSCIITGVLNITNPGDVTINEVYISFGNTYNMLTNFSHSQGRLGWQTSHELNNYTIEIPELSPGNYSTWVYNVSCLQVSPPLSMDTKYLGLHQGLDRKVLAGENWTIVQNVSNALVIPENLTSVKIEIYTNSIWYNISDITTEAPFFLTRLNEFHNGIITDAANVTGHASNNWNWNWTPNNGLIEPGQEWNISFVVTAPNATPNSGIYLALTEVMSYQVPYSSSNISIQEIRGIGPIAFGESKKIVQPADNNPNSTNVTWQADAYINVSHNISYMLKRVTLWVTQSLNPTDTASAFGRLNQTYFPERILNITQRWYTHPSGIHNESWRFNFTDGSDLSSPPPIVWMRPYFELINGYNQIINSSFTQSGKDFYMKYIYVVNGYWLQVDKNVTNIGPDNYRINITVENIGNAWTPSGLTVTVYDFVPAAFNWTSPATFSQAPSQTEIVTSGTFNGTAIRWNVPRKIPYNASLGPKTETIENRRWSVQYEVNGTGDYRVSQLYIVGLDPRKVEGAGTHEGITVISGFVSGTKEVIYLVGLIALIGLNVLNFIMTRRIKQKLEN